MSISKERVLSALKGRRDKSMHTMEIATAIGVDRKRGGDVRDALIAMKELGLVRELPGNRWRPEDRPRRGSPDSEPTRDVGASEDRGRRGRPLSRAESRAPSAVQEPTADEPGTRVGWLAMTGRGFGFVTADDGAEVFVHASQVGPALHRDRVRVRVERSAKGEEGTVVSVLLRGMQRVGGTLVRGLRGYEVSTEDPRLPRSFAVEGGLPLEARVGAEVEAQLIEEGPPTGSPRVRVLRVLGPRGSAFVEVEKVKLREGVDEDFPLDVRTEALSFPAVVDRVELGRREDLRHLPFLTIDPKDARDHDDAVWAERLPGGSFRVIVAIADVSFYVRPGTAIDREALARGCSIYLPDRAIPMLPPELSSNLASLLPDEDRLMLGVEAEVTKAGVVRNVRFVEAAMRSAARLSYEAAAQALGLSEDAAPHPLATAHVGLLRVLLAVSTVLRARRQRRGALGFELPETKVLLDDGGEPRDVVVSKADPGVKRAYELIEDLMLLANEAVAEHLAASGLPGIFRVHGRPDEGKLTQFAAVASALGFDLGEVEEITPKALQAFLSRIEGTPLEGPVGYLLLRSMQQATYHVDDIGHFALAARHYLHFTSPIRRYPDLAVHRIVRALARGEALDREGLRKALVPQAVQSSRMERRAMQVERGVQAIYRVILMRPRVGEDFAGRVTAINDQALMVLLQAPAVEVRVAVSQLGEDYYELDRLGIAFVGSRSGHRVALGDEVVVRIEAASMERLEIQASLVSGGGKAGPRRSKAPVHRAGPSRPTSPKVSARASTPARKGAKSRAKPSARSKKR